MESPIIRRATTDDVAALAEFNRGIARETEGIELKPEVISAGIERFLNRPEYGFYLVAEAAGEVVGSLMITMEWSDWRNGLIWWIQSVYVSADFRRQGVYRRLYATVKEMAKSEPDVCGFRLYVERENEVAQNVYHSVGMSKTPYRIFEELKPGVEFFTRGS